MNTKKKSKKGIVIGLIILAIVGAVIFFMMSSRIGTSGFSDETVKTSNIKTYYSFSGIVEAKNRETVTSDSAIKISKVKVSEGDIVSKDDVLFITTNGTNIKAPIDGEISNIYVKKDEQVMTGAKLIEIVDYNHLQVTVKVDEYDLSCISMDKQVEVTINSIEKELTGKVSKISKEATSINGVSYFTATIDLLEDSQIKIGMNAEVKIVNKDIQNVTTVSMKALKFDESNHPYVIIKSDKSTTENKYIKTGINDGIIVQITEGLNSGDIVLVEKASANINAQMSGFRDSAGGGIE